MFIFLTILEKKALNVSATSRFSDKMLLAFTRVMLSLLTLLFENTGFTVFQNILLSEIFNIFKIVSFFFLQETGTVVPLFIICNLIFKRSIIQRDVPKL